jgi:hypothetical protein
MSNQLVRRNSNQRKKNRGLKHDLVDAFADAALRQAGRGAKKGMEWLYNGIASAFRTTGNNGSKQEMKAMVAPLARALQIKNPTPRYTNVAGGVSIEHTEPLTVVYGANRFTLTSETFEWLAPMTAGFEEYRIRIEVGWVPTCPATTTGRVMMAFDYDPSDRGGYESTDTSDYLNTADHCISAVWSPCAIAPKQSGWLKTGLVGDERLYSPGTLHLVVPSIEDGMILARYHVDLRKPQPTSKKEYVQFGYYTATSGPFAGLDTVSGVSAFTIEDTKLTQKYPGTYQVSWSTDGGVVGITLEPGSKPESITSTLGNFAGMFYTYAVGDVVSFTPIPSPGGATHYKLVIVPVPTSTVYG